MLWWPVTGSQDPLSQVSRVFIYVYDMYVLTQASWRTLLIFKLFIIKLQTNGVFMFVSLINETLRPDWYFKISVISFFIKKIKMSRENFQWYTQRIKLHGIGSRNVNGSNNLESRLTLLMYQWFWAGLYILNQILNFLRANSVFKHVFIKFIV